MEEPSNPCPSSKVSSPNSLIGTEKCCQIPTKSINLKSTISAPCSLANSTTCFGVINNLLSCGLYDIRAHPRHAHLSLSEQPPRQRSQKSCHHQFCRSLPPALSPRQPWRLFHQKQ